MHKAIRYIGSKQNLLGFLEESIFNSLPENAKILDAFSGSTIVSQFLNKQGFLVEGADFSTYSKRLFSFLTINKNNLDIEKIKATILTINNKAVELLSQIKVDKNIVLKNNLFITNECANIGSPVSYKESRNYFNNMAAICIDLLKQEISNNNALNNSEKDFLWQVLLTFADKMANTTGVFAAYLKEIKDDKNIPLSLVDTIYDKITNITDKHNLFYQGDIFDTLSVLKENKHFDLIYFDPPYNSRKYESNYHILNYVADINFVPDMIKDNSKTALPNKKINNAFGSIKTVKDAFEKLIISGLTISNKIAISYNTDGNIKQQEIEAICFKNNIKLTTFEKEYPRYKSRNQENDNNNQKELKELLWIMEKN